MDKVLAIARHLKDRNLNPADLARLKGNLHRNKLFIIAYAYYLISLLNDNTRKQYKGIIDQFIRFEANIRAVTPLDAIGIDIDLWRNDLLRTGGVAGSAPGSKNILLNPQEKSSVHTKVSVLSAFFKFLQKPGLDGSPPLMIQNPVDALQRRFKIEKYGRSKKISRDVLTKVLKSIDLRSIKGLRDYTLVYGYFITGRRNTEWLTMKWGQLNFNTSPPTYSFLRKGQKDTTDELPDRLLSVVVTYLRKRWGEDFNKKILPSTYLFTAMPGKGGARQVIDPNQPLSQRSMLRIIKNYANVAGFDSSKITVHSLRHLHAESYLEAGASVEEVRARLGHRSLATTQQYVSSMKNEKNRLASTLDEMLKES